MHLPKGRGKSQINASEMLKEQYPIIGTGEWDDIQCQNFKGEKNGLANGDIVMVREGNKPIALCEIIGDCFQNEELSKKYINHWFRRVKVLGWADKNESNSLFSQGTLTRLKENSNTPSWNYINNWYNRIMNNKDMENFKALLTNNKNLILTGAPGTGKTYLAKQIAKQMIGATIDEELEQSGQFAFVQFHPSYDYTDFVEGLRPTKSEDSSNIGFKLEDGIFKKFCNKALENLINSEKSLEELQNKSNIEKILDSFLTNSIENGIEFEYKNNTNKFVIIPHPKEEEYFYAKILNNESMERQLVAKKDVVMVLEKANAIEKPTDIQKLFNTKFKYQYTFMFLILERLRNELKTKVTQSVKKIEKKNFIFIIDEINRGEISKIFGELFFSIDPSYRGEKGAVKTQYSNMHEDENEVFYIPENVYIIGTMNDIDRSVESFDFAMRRRFTWKEITAKESQKMFDDEDWQDEAIKRMDNLNNVIWNEEEHIDGLNSSYHIGAAYFKNNLPKYDDSKKWNKLWEYHLLPLLSEYLRGTPNVTENIEKLANAYNAG